MVSPRRKGGDGWAKDSVLLRMGLAKGARFLSWTVRGEEGKIEEKWERKEKAWLSV